MAVVLPDLLKDILRLLGRFVGSDHLHASRFLCHARSDAGLLLWAIRGARFATQALVEGA